METQGSGSGAAGEDPLAVVVVAGNLELAFPIEHVIEIVPLDAVTPLFRLPEHILGVCNVRGRVLPVSDLSRLLGSGARAAAEGGKGVLVRRSPHEVIFSISRVVGTQRLPASGLDRVPVTFPERLRPLVRGLLPGDPPVPLLDPGLLLDLPDAWPCWQVRLGGAS